MLHAAAKGHRVDINSFTSLLQLMPEEPETDEFILKSGFISYVNAHYLEALTIL